MWFHEDIFRFSKVSLSQEQGSTVRPFVFQIRSEKVQLQIKVGVKVSI